MKTTNNDQKTGKNQMSLLIVIAIVVISSLSPLNRTASAQEFMKDLLSNASNEKIALSLVNHTSLSAGNSYASENPKLLSEANETEVELKVESWMTDSSLFNIGQNTEEQEEKKLKLEDWMTKADNFWKAEDSSTTVELEPALKVENWMLDNSKW